MICRFARNYAGFPLQFISKIGLLLAVLLAGSASPMLATEVGLFHLPNKESNTMLLMRGVSAGKAQVAVVFRRGKQQQIALQIRREMRFAQGAAQLTFRLPEGSYQVAISIGNEVFTRNYTAPTAAAGYAASDIVLANAPFAARSLASQPEAIRRVVLGKEIQERQPLFWLMRIGTAVQKRVSVRLVLYRQAQGKERVAAYSSVWQRNYVRELSGEAWLTDSLPTHQLTAGDYIVEVLAYDGKTRIAERSITFSLPWTGFARLYADVPTAVRMMRWAWKPATLDSVLRLPAVRQREAFDGLWRQRFPQDTRQAMQRYYTAIFAAETRFAQPNQAGWQTERGGTFVRFGEPDAVERQGITEIWVYKKWGRVVVK